MGIAIVIVITVCDICGDIADHSICDFCIAEQEQEEYFRLLNQDGGEDHWACDAGVCEHYQRR